MYFKNINFLVNLVASKIISFKFSSFKNSVALKVINVPNRPPHKTLEKGDSSRGRTLCAAPALRPVRSGSKTPYCETI